ncbi:ATP-binding cassette domain-containing protein [Streptomyces sp. SID8381]|uniref:metal ABC transporter ATP-binding protein n=1 Tax=unclassified Streptomyces TaxID=2593676 RepID=UPI00035EFC99|nr:MULTISPECIES: ABC transporter ATP-binding protein [unclassified Streptomyces]MYX25434.1 ATP-binding cassette domain-containing protein [Streptomyces sp. SID8381]NMO34622.1 ABC transporter ATP-binding protein [Streptomyces sp. GMY02]
MSAQAEEPVIRAENAALAYGSRTVWQDLELEVGAGEFLAVLGPNGSGKTSFMKALLGRVPLSAGQLTVLGRSPGRSGRRLGYVPQQSTLVGQAALRARDLVRLGIDGHRFGLGLPNRSAGRRVDEILAAVGATEYADVPLDLLSGGERQRVRVGQALATDPQLLLCDEPLLSLDLRHQRAVTELVDARRRSHGTAVVFVTHEINPVLGMADRVLYLARGRHRIGSPDEVLTSQSLSELYGTRVDVLRVRGRVVVVGAPDEPTATHHHEPEPPGVRLTAGGKRGARA